jgi:RNA polymerase sigma factor (sigma-70 family)
MTAAFAPQASQACPNPQLTNGCRRPGIVAGELSDAQLLRRFTDRQDAAAFAVLVRRHTPMVLGVCRRRLGDAHGAEDACQAVFLVLVRRAHAIARPELLAGWLYGVAWRIAGGARAKASRRAALERQTSPATAPDPLPEVARREVASLLTDEVSRLPEKYRAPLVLCYLEGKTNVEAAQELGWPAGSMSRRLARGRELLRQRLTRRGPDIVW